MSLPIQVASRLAAIACSARGTNSPMHKWDVLSPLTGLELSNPPRLKK